jgi:hypothetical protein
MKITITHKLPTSAQMRAQLTANIKQGDWPGAFHNGPPLPPGTFIAGSLVTAEQMQNQYARLDEKIYGRDGVRRFDLRLRAPRKRVSEKSCKGGHTCLPGLGGKCVACSEDDDT